MSYTEIKGNLFNSSALTLGNTVNCLGFMGKGIALEFRRRFPLMFRAYQRDCEQKKLQPGRIYYYPTEEILILNIATKNHWRFPSKLKWIMSALEQFVNEYKQKNISSIAFPLLGAQSGGLDKEEVKKTMRNYLQGLNDIDIEVYEYDPSASDPLFRTLVGLCAGNSSNQALIRAGLPKISIHQIIDLIKTGKIRSLNQLAESRVLGEKGLDKLYNYLTLQAAGKTNDQTTQLTLF